MFTTPVLQKVIEDAGLLCVGGGGGGGAGECAVCVWGALLDLNITGN